MRSMGSGETVVTDASSLRFALHDYIKKSAPRKKMPIWYHLIKYADALSLRREYRLHLEHS